MADPANEHRLFWESNAGDWIGWARTPGHDAYWDYSPTFFRDIVPEPSGRTLEIGCGEGRVSRDLSALGHDVSAIDGAPSLLRAAHEADRDHDRYVIADAAKLPFGDESFGCVIAYNVLMDVDDLLGTVREAARVLRREGRFCICVTHPMVDVGSFETRTRDARFVIDGDYLTSGVFDQTFERAGLTMRFRGSTVPLEGYFAALEGAGFLIERLLEPAQRPEAVEADPAEGRWQRLPNFLFMRAVKP